MSVPQVVKCGGLECEYCDDAQGIAVITHLDSLGDVYRDGTSVLLYGDEWVVLALDKDAPFGSREAARYPRDKVVGFRFLPCEMQTFVHHIVVPEVP